MRSSLALLGWVHGKIAVRCSLHGKITLVILTTTRSKLQAIFCTPLRSNINVHFSPKPTRMENINDIAQRMKRSVSVVYSG